MIKIWGRANSTNVKKVLWCAEELQLPYQRLDAGGAYGIVDTAAFGAMNPNRRVPALEDEGLVLWESNSIVRYLAVHRLLSAPLPQQLERQSHPSIRFRQGDA